MHCGSLDCGSLNSGALDCGAAVHCGSVGCGKALHCGAALDCGALWISGLWRGCNCSLSPGHDLPLGPPVIHGGHAIIITPSSSSASASALSHYQVMVPHKRSNLVEKVNSETFEKALILNLDVMRGELEEFNEKPCRQKVWLVSWVQCSAEKTHSGDNFTNLKCFT